jgi:predicted type IV restriction endonuclease
MATTQQLVEQLRTKIARYHAPLGEQNTKAALIEPLLRALGWDGEDVDEVHREYKLRAMDNPVDYALMLERKPVEFDIVERVAHCDIRVWPTRQAGTVSESSLLAGGVGAAAEPPSSSSSSLF